MSRFDLEKLEAIRHRIGDVIVDPCQWISVMEDLCTVVGATGAALLRGDVRTSDVPITPSVQDAFASYFRNNLHIGDIRAAKGLPLLAADRSAVRDQDLFSSEREMLLDPLYAHLTPYKLRWFAGLSFKADASTWVVTLQRSVAEGMFDDSDMVVLSSLSSTLSSAATLSSKVGNQVLTDKLNAFSMIGEPTLAVSASGVVIEVNAPAERLFDSEFRVLNRKLVFRDNAATEAYGKLLQSAASESFFSPILSRGAVRNIVVRRHAKRPILIRVLPVEGAARSPFMGARFILLLRDIDLQRTPAIDVVSKIFLLSPAEAKVAVMIASGLSPDEIAVELALSKETVRNQLKAVFYKTETHRQNELAALILRAEYRDRGD